MNNKARYEEITKYITEKLVKEYQPEKIYLFGSLARGEIDKDSDVDILIVKDTPKRRFDREFEVTGLFYPRDFALDAVVVTPEELVEKRKTNSFIRRAFKEAKLLYEKK